MTDSKETIETIVKRHYEPCLTPATVDGAQMWQGKWWMPLSGCDTLQNMLEDIQYAFVLREEQARKQELQACWHTVRDAITPGGLGWEGLMLAANLIMERMTSKTK